MNEYWKRQSLAILATWRGIFTGQRITIFHHNFHNARIVAEKRPFRKIRKKSNFFTKNMWDPIFRRHARNVETHFAIEVKRTVKETN